jgi:hypothetical protein
LGFCLIATDLLYLQEKSGGLLQFARRQTDWSSLSSSRVPEIFGDKLGASRFIDFCRLLRAVQRYQLLGVVAGHGWIVIAIAMRLPPLPLLARALFAALVSLSAWVTGL